MSKLTDEEIETSLLKVPSFTWEEIDDPDNPGTKLKLPKLADPGPQSFLSWTNAAPVEPGATLTIEDMTATIQSIANQCPIHGDMHPAGDCPPAHCFVCFTTHGPKDAHAQVVCSDCECQHYGTEDECVCEEDYCLTCGCGEPAACAHCDSYGEYGHECCDCGAASCWEPESDVGCAACHWHYSETGEWDPCCGYGDAGVADDACSYFSTYENRSLTGVKGREFFSVREVAAVKPDEVTAGSERGVGQQLGLDPMLDLGMAVADFYILERLYENLHDRSWSYDARSGSVRANGLRTPAEFGSDSRLERLAYEVANTRSSMNRKLAKQFEVYLIMAVGGELRHAPSLATRAAKKGERNTPRSQWPRGTNRAPHKLFPDWIAYYFNEKRQPIRRRDMRHYGCAACAWAVTEGGFEPYNPTKFYPSGQIKRVMSPCNRWEITEKPSGMMTKRLRPSTHANTNCSAFHLWAKEHGVTYSADARRVPYKPHTRRMERYFEKDQKEWERGERGLAWRQWVKLYAEEGPALIKDCAAVFNKWTWNRGYGGPAWGSAAQFTFEYSQRKMSDSAFIDRCWTLEHNGGCIFNKFYERGIRKLKEVLNTQAADDQRYTRLRAEASQYTLRLLGEYERLTGGEREAKVFVNA